MVQTLSKSNRWTQILLFRFLIFGERAGGSGELLLCPSQVRSSPFLRYFCVGQDPPGRAGGWGAGSPPSPQLAFNFAHLALP